MLSKILGIGLGLIIDGGGTKVGVELTVLYLTVKPPQILRSGGVSFEELKKILKNIKPHPFLLGKELKDKVIKSPGMKYCYYAPKAPLILVGGKTKKRTSRIRSLIKKYQKQNKKVGVLSPFETKKGFINKLIWF